MIIDNDHVLLRDADDGENDDTENDGGGTDHLPPGQPCQHTIPHSIFMEGERKREREREREKKR